MAVDFTTVPTTYPGAAALTALGQGVGEPNLTGKFNQYLNNPMSLWSQQNLQPITLQGVYNQTGGMGNFGYMNDLLNSFNTQLAPFLKANNVNNLLAQGLATGGAGQGLANSMDQKTVASMLPVYANQFNQFMQPGMQQLSNLAGAGTSFLSNALNAIPNLMSMAGQAALTPERFVQDPASFVNNINPFTSTAPGSFSNPVGGFGQGGGVGPLGNPSGGTATASAAGSAASAKGGPGGAGGGTEAAPTTAPPVNGGWSSDPGNYGGYGSSWNFDPYSTPPNAPGYNGEVKTVGGYTPYTFGSGGLQQGVDPKTGQGYDAYGAGGVYNPSTGSQAGSVFGSVPLSAPVNPNTNPVVNPWVKAMQEGVGGAADAVQQHANSGLYATNYGTPSWGGGLGYSQPQGYG